MPETPLSNETLVNTTTAGDQFFATIAALVGGGFVIVWDEPNERTEVFGQRFDAAGNKIGGEFQVNLTTTSVQLVPSIAPLTGGGFVVAWQSDFGANANILARRFDSGGLPLGNDFLVNTTTANEQGSTQVTGLDGGGFLVTWDTRIGGSAEDVRGQIYNAAGNPVGGEFLINSTTANAQGFSSLAPLPGGGFVAVWASIANPPFTSIVGQRVDANGAKVGGEFQVNLTTSGDQFGADVARMSDGGFVVTWTDDKPGTGTGGAVLARRYDASGAAVSGEVTLFSKVTDSVASTSVTALADGAFVVGWFDDLGATSRIAARAFDAANAPITDTFEVSQSTGERPVITSGGLAALSNGTVVFAWDSGPAAPPFDNDIFFRRYQIDVPDGGPIDGSGGDDTLPGTSGDDTINGLGGNDVLNGLDGSDTLNGGDGNDILNGDGDDDLLNGGAGADAMNGGAGNDAGLIDDDGDLFSGGDGTDTAVVQGSFGALTVAVDSTTEVVLVASGADTRFGDTANNFYDYSLSLSSSGGGDALTVIAGDLRAGEDLVLNGSGVGSRDLRIFAGRGDDNLTGGAGNDGFFFGVDGNWTNADLVAGAGDVDSLAFRGNYSITFQNGSFAGIEVIALLTGLANPFGGPIVAGGFDFDLTLADGNVAAGQQLDVVGTSLGASETMSVNGSGELDGTLRLFGGAGDDILVGGFGADLLFGNLGADQLSGGPGGDTYAYRAVADATAASRDTINYLDGDRIDLSFIDANSGTPANDDFTNIGDSAFGNVAGQLRVFSSGVGQVTVEGDVDGDGLADLVILVNTVIPIEFTL